MRYDEVKQKERHTIEKKGCDKCEYYFHNSYYPDVCKKYKKSIFLIADECTNILNTFSYFGDFTQIDDEDIPF